MATSSQAQRTPNLNLPLAGGVYNIQAFTADRLITTVQNLSPSVVAIISPTNGQFPLVPATLTHYRHHANRSDRRGENRGKSHSET